MQKCVQVFLYFHPLKLFHTHHPYSHTRIQLNKFEIEGIWEAPEKHLLHKVFFIYPVRVQNYILFNRVYYCSVFMNGLLFPKELRDYYHLENLP